MIPQIVPVLPTELINRAGVHEGKEGFWISILLIVESACALLASPVAGHLVDAHNSRQTYFLFASVLVFGSILWIALSSSIPLFVVGRMLQGFGTAFVRVSGFALVLDAVPEDKVGWTLGWTGMANTAGFTIGPVLGGVLYKYGGWWFVFGPLLGMLFFDFVLRFTVIERKRVFEEETEAEIPEEVATEGNASEVLPQARTKQKRKNGQLVLLSQPRMRFMIWGVIASGILISAFDAVSLQHTSRRMSANMTSRLYQFSSAIGSAGIRSGRA